MTLSELPIRFPTFYSGAKILKDWGWLLVFLFLAIGFRFKTPSAQFDEIMVVTRGLQDSVVALRLEQRGQSTLILWSGRMICKKLLTASERDVALACLP